MAILVNESFLKTMFKLKSLLTGEFQIKTNNESDINIKELILLHSIADNSNFKNNVTPSEICKSLALSKGAISQMLTNLENKSLLVREIDKNNRRNIIATLTPQGRQLLTSKYEEYNLKLKKIINNFGEDNINQFINLVEKLVSVLENA